MIKHLMPLLLCFSFAAQAQVFFQDDFESDPSDWVCADGVELVNWGNFNPMKCFTDLDPDGEWKMGPGRNGGNAVYCYKRDDVDTTGYRCESHRVLYGNDVKTDIYHQWYMKVDPTFDKTCSYFKFWRYLLREDAYKQVKTVFLNVGCNPKWRQGKLEFILNTVPNQTLNLVDTLDFSDNEWHLHELRIKVPSNGVDDGIIQYWLDGVLEVTYTDLKFFEETEDLGVHRFSVGIGNTSDPNYDMPDWTGIGFDDIKVSTSYIGPEEDAEPREALFLTQ